MQITLSFDNFTELPYTSGTVQNISSQATVEICQDDTANTGLILGPGEWFSWSNSTVYARSAWDYEPVARCAVVPFKKGEEGGGEYILPVATNNTLGGVKIGDGLSVTSDGTLSAAGGGTSIDEWTAGNTYAVGDFVTHQNLLYKCITANSDSAWTPANWQKIGDVNFMGATSSVNGTNGLVPPPTTNDISKFLCGDGTWKSITNGDYTDKSLLWSGTNLDIASVDSITLSDIITNYDVIVMNVANGTASSYSFVNTSYISVGLSAEAFIDSSYSKIRVAGYILLSTPNKLIFTDKVFGTVYTPSNTCSIDVYGIKFIPNPNNYSTTEQEIGTWIDGKPLYQKTYTGTSVNTAAIPVNANLDTVVEIEGCTKISGVDYPLNYYVSPSEYGNCVVGFDANTSVNDRVIYLSHGNGTRDYNITIKYTKV